MKPSGYRYLDAIHKHKTDRTPIWLMRQAGRYLPEYRKVREKYNFLQVCKTPELATEVTIQPIRRYGFDAAILFSDILVIPEAMGQKLEFLADHGPKLTPQLLDERTLENLSNDNLEERLQYVADALKMIRPELDNQTALIGFSGSPFTLATYMIEGKPTRNFKYIKQMLFSNPELLHRILNQLADAVTRYLRMQIEAGAQAVQIFDTWGGILPPHLYHDFSGKYMMQITAALKDLGAPVTLFSKGGFELLTRLADSQADMLGVDWMTDLSQARAQLGDKFALQGNLDPTALYGSKEVLRKEISQVLEVFKGDSGHVFNLGHGILPDIPLDTVEFLVNEVREQSARLRG